MSRINVRYYKAHPPGSEREWSLATYVIRHRMTPEQRERFAQWSKDVIKAIWNTYERVSTALIGVFNDMQPSMKRLAEAIDRCNVDYILQHPDEVKAYSAELFKDYEPTMRGEWNGTTDR